MAGCKNGTFDVASSPDPGVVGFGEFGGLGLDCSDQFEVGLCYSDCSTKRRSKRNKTAQESNAEDESESCRRWHSKAGQAEMTETHGHSILLTTTLGLKQQLISHERDSRIPSGQNGARSGRAAPLEHNKAIKRVLKAVFVQSLKSGLTRGYDVVVAGVIGELLQARAPLAALELPADDLGVLGGCDMRGSTAGEFGGKLVPDEGVERDEIGLVRLRFTGGEGGGVVREMKLPG